jgi:NADPH:quinone reductase-like Zn-dependent oxidoreductase
MRSVVDQAVTAARSAAGLRGGLPHAGQHARHPDPDILAAFAYRLDLICHGRRAAMKAVVCTRYGGPDVLRLADAETPVPGDGQVLVKVHAASLNASDWEMLRGKPLYARIGGPFRPRHHVLGSDIAGRVESTGRNATRFRPGDDVFADILSSMGGFAEYVCVPQTALAPIPAGLTYEQAAALPQAGAIALQGIRDTGRVRPGHKVLINGGGGGSGMYAVQLAKLDGAEVTGVDNAEKLEFMRSLGADHVIDYAREDFTRNGRGYDLVLDLAAYRPASAYRRSLLPGGRYLYVGGSVATLLQVLTIGPVIGRAARKKIRLLAVRLGVQHLDPLVELIRAGKITTVIDRRFPLSEVPEALRYLGEGHAKGKVVVTVG